MRDDTPVDLATYRLDQAKEFLQDAETNNNNDSLKTAANRSYYCIFHAMRAVLALDNLDFRKHSGVISAFREKYIKTGIFPNKLSDAIKEAFTIRSDSDYKDFYIVSKDKVITQIENAKTFLDTVEKYVNERIQENRM
jgi:uncharacterized protein (UPF0332 family)